MGRHEERQHGGVAEQEAMEEDEKKEDYRYNYHCAKLTFGLILMEFNDCVKEGDGDRLFSLYRLALLLYKNLGHPKYAYVVLLHLVKCIAILPPQQALSCKWNRFFNSSGGSGHNIPLDLKKEQQNQVLKTMWRALGPNLDEKNAERTAGTLETMEVLYASVDKDCVTKNKSHRTSTKDDEAVTQILKDLIKQEAFKKIDGREGYAAFPKFERSLFHGLDYRDLNQWIQEHIDLWASIYQ